MMSRKRNEGLVDQLALARAAGVPISVWCAQFGVPVSTAYHWAGSGAFKLAVVRYHKELARKTLDRYADRLARNTTHELIPA
jgi:hypothetical protein